MTDAANSDRIRLGNLSRSPGFLLRLSQLQVFNLFYEALGHDQLRPGEFSVIWLISLNPGVRQGVLAKRLMIKPAHMTKLVKRLEDAGHVQRTIEAGDRRAVQLTLTAKGKRLVDARKSEVFGYIAHENVRLSAAEMAELTRLLQKFVGIEGDSL
ncbi:MarR family transcriptional regulator [uncultured Roseovarius sp.]|uniref:MarR family winged helix-turn-helix transcriptional regulator n=1 Tax=uncultured Roseovarius sp. TaxID=293344 RepID=UPI002613596B|nr:MarR family transcriptional regulator [uncultured Roseovarius sp.]